MDAAGWSDWRPLRLAQAIPAEGLREQLDGGQAFRWHEVASGEWVGVFDRVVAGVRVGADGAEARVRGPVDAGFAALRAYLDAEGAQARLAADLPWRSDAVLAAAMQLHPGLRILRQPPRDALIGFLCSSNKRILQIREMVARLASELGADLGGGHRALPEWAALARADDATLKRCALGYRAAFLRGTAERLQARPDWAEEFAALPTPALLAELRALPGVGPKVAACVALFGFGRLESFPVDTWVVQALGGAYGLVGWPADRLEAFGRVHYGPAAGLAQQFLFSAARAGRLPVAANAPSPLKDRPRARERRRR
jgi:N-glycosylase/DNA lyase